MLSPHKRGVVEYYFCFDCDELIYEYDIDSFVTY